MPELMVVVLGIALALSILGAAGAIYAFGSIAVRMEAIEWRVGQLELRRDRVRATQTTGMEG